MSVLPIDVYGKQTNNLKCIVILLATFSISQVRISFSVLHLVITFYLKLILMSVFNVLSIDRVC